MGPRTAAKMHRLKLFTCADVRERELPFLISQFGKLGTSLYQAARGIDSRAVHTQHPRKSISVETTFAHDLRDLSDALTPLSELHTDLLVRIERHQAQPLIQKTFVKLRMANFKIHTLEMNSMDLSRAHFAQLLANLCQKHEGAFRLLGVGVRLREPDEAGQLDLLDS